MPDRWKAKVRTIAGHAAALVTLHIERTILVDAEVWERFSRHFKSDSNVPADKEDIRPPLGLSGVGDLYEDIQTIPEKSRSYVAIDWTDADNSTIGLERLSDIAKLLDIRPHIRIEGGVEAGFVGYLNFGGQDHIIDLSEKNAPMVVAQMQMLRSQYEVDNSNGLLTPEDKALADQLCDAVEGQAKVCIDKYGKFKQEQAERDRKQQESMKRDRQLQEKAAEQQVEPTPTPSRGDFGRDFGKDFGNVA